MLKKLNNFIYRFKYNYGRYLDLSKPVDISLELASMCNQRCSYCYHADQDKLPFTKGIMRLETARMIIQEAAWIGVNSIKFNYRGEPTLNPHFREIAELAESKAKGMVFIDRIVNSNFKFATHNEEIFKGLCSLTKVKVSFDSFDASVMETQRAGSIHRIALANIDKFYSMYDRTKTTLVIQAVRTQLNKDEPLFDLIKERWPDAQVSIRDMVKGRVDNDLESLAVKEQSKKRIPCKQAFSRLIFDHTGKAQMCCPDIDSKLQLGSIWNRSMSALFNCSKARTVRRGLINGGSFKMDPCKTCPSFESYEGYKAGWNS